MKIEDSLLKEREDLLRQIGEEGRDFCKECNDRVDIFLRASVVCNLFDQAQTSICNVECRAILCGSNDIAIALQVFRAGLCNDQIADGSLVVLILKYRLFSSERRRGAWCILLTVYSSMSLTRGSCSCFSVINAVTSSMRSLLSLYFFEKINNERRTKMGGMRNIITQIAFCAEAGCEIPCLTSSPS